MDALAHNRCYALPDGTVVRAMFTAYPMVWEFWRAPLDSTPFLAIDHTGAVVSLVTELAEPGPGLAAQPIGGAAACDLTLDDMRPVAPGACGSPHCRCLHQGAWPVLSVPS